MKMKIKRKIRSYRYYIDLGLDKYANYKKCPGMMVNICIKQHLSNI